MLVEELLGVASSSFGSVSALIGRIGGTFLLSFWNYESFLEMFYFIYFWSCLLFILESLSAAW